ncbi:MAG: ferredoxin-thioredoxin reductase catalytic domain-containing protein [Arcobacteraceae bacterium]
MIQKIDVNSIEFINELKLTENFTDKVCEKFGFVYNPQNDVNTSTQQGLTRNQIIYGKRFCPCFMVIGETQEEQNDANNRVCPCKPALEEEIPKSGRCHCGIFCTPEFAKENAIKDEMQETEATKTSGLTKKECEVLLQKKNINSNELEELLQAREEKLIEFNLVDVREWMEWVGARIKGCDYLVPTTSFYKSLEQLENKKDTPMIVYCHIGSRSAYCQNILRDSGFQTVCNLEHGIAAYEGELENGEKM